MAYSIWKLYADSCLKLYCSRWCCYIYLTCQICALCSFLFLVGGGGVVVGGLSVAILCQYDVSHNNI